MSGSASTQPSGSAEDRAAAGSAGLDSSTVLRTAVQRLDNFIASQARGVEPPIARGYRLVNKLGEGTYGTVWLALDRSGAQVAIKFFAHGTGQQWQQLQDEVRNLASLDTTFGIIPLKDVEPEADPPYFVMSFAEGGSLQAKVDQGPMPVREALALFAEIARALAFVHAKGIRHCDLKPGNILLNQHGQPMIADFGQAHLSDDASPALGTFYYMAPEQAEEGERIPDTRWDVYGLGAVFYALVMGEPPRRDREVSEQLRRTVHLPQRLQIYRDHVRSRARPLEHHTVPGMDRMLARIIDRCLDLDPEQRLRDAGAILDALATRRRQRRQRPMILFGILAPLLMLLLTFGLGSYSIRQAIQAARDGVTQQVLDSDRLAAELVGNVLQQQFDDRIDLLQALIDPRHSPQLAGWIRDATRRHREARARGPLAPDDLEALSRHLEPMHRWFADRFASIGNTAFANLIIVNPDGYMVARPDRSETPFLRNYSWRDWFSGQGDRHDQRAQARFPPIQEIHVSEPYAGEFMNKGKKLINISVPIRDGEELIGLIVGNISWEKFQNWLSNLRVEGGYVVIVDARGHCLSHAETDKIEPVPGKNPTRFYPANGGAWTQAGCLEDYRDPLDGANYLIGFAPFRPFSQSRETWVAAMQHDPDVVLKPVQDLKRYLTRFGILVLALMSVLIAALWAWLIWMLRSEERMAHG